MAIMRTNGLLRPKAYVMRGRCVGRSWAIKGGGKMHWILLTIAVIFGIGFAFFLTLFLVYLFEKWRDQ